MNAPDLPPCPSSAGTTSAGRMLHHRVLEKLSGGVNDTHRLPRAATPRWGPGGGVSEVAGLCSGPHTCVCPAPAVLAAGLFPQPHLQLPRLGAGKEKAGVNQKKWTLPRKHSSNPSGSSPSLEWVRDNNTKFAFELAFPGGSGNKPRLSRIQSLSDLHNLEFQRPTQTQLRAITPKEWKLPRVPARGWVPSTQKPAICADFTLLTLRPLLGLLEAPTRAVGTQEQSKKVLRT